MQNRKNRLAKKAKPTDIISHWPKLIENLQFSSQEFYAKVEAALAQRKVPDLKMERVDWKEGGPLSARREYLRLTRERLVFDVCGAPFGTGFFVSLWYGERPLRFGFLAWLLLLLAFIAGVGLALFGNWITYALWRIGFHVEAPQVMVLLALVLGAAMIGFVIIVGPNLDQLLIQTPLIGYFYERFFRRITLYRIDRNCMYLAAVHSAVTDVIDEISKAQGIQPLSELERRPVFLQLFQPQGSNGHN